MYVHSVSTSSNDCPLIYQMLDKDHSYCAQKISVRSLPTTSKEIELILEMHNEERLQVNAKDMQKLYWNDDLADIAQRYADHCDYKHEKSIQRQAPRLPLSTGQNLAMGYKDWALVIRAWADEKKDFVYGEKTQRGVVGHYTQMVKATAVLIGCGLAICPKSSVDPHRDWPHYVCNYVTGQTGDNEPYKPSDSITSNNKQLHGLSLPFNEEKSPFDTPDCHGRVCLYNGKLDLHSCQCQCEHYAAGEQCEHLNCSTLSDQCDYGDDKSLCTTYANVPLECPKFCGLCERYDEMKKHYPSSNFLSEIKIQTLRNTQLVSSLGNLSQSFVFIQLIIVPFVLFLIK